MAFMKTLAELEAEKGTSSDLENYLNTSKKGYTSCWSEGEHIKIAFGAGGQTGTGGDIMIRGGCGTGTGPDDIINYMDEPEGSFDNIVDHDKEVNKLLDEIEEEIRGGEGLTAPETKIEVPQTIWTLPETEPTNVREGTTKTCYTSDTPAPKKDIHWTPDWAMNDKVEWSGLQQDIEELDEMYVSKFEGCSDVDGKRTTKKPDEEKDTEKVEQVFMETNIVNRNGRMYVEGSFVDGYGDPVNFLSEDYTKKKVEKLHKESNYDRAMEIVK